MGYTTSKKMIPLLLLQILWKHSDEKNMISLEEICIRMREWFEPANNWMSQSAMQKLVSSNIKQINTFFEDTGWSLDGEHSTTIIEKTIANPHCAGGYIKVYYIQGRVFDETEIRLLSDSVLFSPGIDQKLAKRMISKLRRCASKHFGDWFEQVQYVDIIKRSNNERLFELLMLIGSAIKKKRKIAFGYRKNGKLSESRFKVSPFYLVISAGKYYLLCNKEGKESIAPYRLDRIEEVTILEGETVRRIENLQEVGGCFNLERFMAEHPRMTFEKPVSATLLVSEGMVEAVHSEFYVLSTCKIQDDLYRIRISSTKTSICNWIINVTDQIKIETSSDQSVIDLLCQRARNIIAFYQPETIEWSPEFLN